MSLSKYVSDVKIVKQNNDIVYNFLSDFNNLGSFFNEYTLAQISQQMPKFKISGVKNDTDSMSFTVDSYGEVGIRIIERESPKTIKIEGEGKLPFSVYLWIQILPVTFYESKIRVTIHANLNVMMKMLLGKKLEDGVNKVAEALTHLPYH